MPVELNRIKILDMARKLSYDTKGATVSLDFYKKELNLAYLAVKGFGYEINIAKTGNNILRKEYKYITLTKYKEGTRIREDEIIIHKTEKGNFHFFVRGDGTLHGNGSCIDLVQRLTAKDFPSTLRVIDEFITKNGLASKDLNLSIEKAQPGEKIIERALSEICNVRPIDNYQYLESRGIPCEILNLPLFKGQIFNARHITHTGEEYDNTAFPIRGREIGVIDYDMYNGLEQEDRAQGFDIKNSNHKSKTSGSYSGFWQTVHDRTRPIDHVFVAESPLDCISHFVLNYNKLSSKNVVYLATCGQLQASQIEMLQSLFTNGASICDEKGQLIHRQRPNNLTILFDRDLKGGFYTAKLLNAMNFPEFSTFKPKMPDTTDLIMMSQETKKHSIALATLSNAVIVASVNDKTNSATVQFNCPLHDEHQYRLYADYTYESMRSEVARLNREYAYKTAEKEPFKLNMEQITRSKLIFSLDFVNIQNHWQIINDLIISYKFGNSPEVAEKIKLEAAIMKDFNDDLQGVKEIDPEITTTFKKRIEKVQSPYKHLYNPAVNEELKNTQSHKQRRI